MIKPISKKTRQWCEKTKWKLKAFFFLLQILCNQTWRHFWSELCLFRQAIMFIVCKFDCKWMCVCICTCFYTQQTITTSAKPPNYPPYTINYHLSPLPLQSWAIIIFPQYGVLHFDSLLQMGLSLLCQCVSSYLAWLLFQSIHVCVFWCMGSYCYELLLTPKLEYVCVCVFTHVCMCVV